MVAVCLSLRQVPNAQCSLLEGKFRADKQRRFTVSGYNLDNRKTPSIFGNYRIDSESVIALVLSSFHIIAA